MTTQIHTLYIVLRHGDINGRLVAQDGRILLIVDNYTELHPQLPGQPVDGNTHIYQVEALDDELAIESDGGREVWRVWKGDKSSRQRPQEKAMLPVRSLVDVQAALPSAATATSPEDAARQAFGELPEEVRLAAVIASVSDRTLIDLRDIGSVIAGRLKQWAEQRLTRHVASGDNG
jgi:hypothetical protein